MKKLRILFIGNSHTYYNDMPNMVAEKSRKEGYDCEVTMIAHGGWFLEQHVQEPDVRFNILYGHYDYVVLQEHSHPFGPEEKLFDAVRQLNTWIREANAKPLVHQSESCGGNIVKIIRKWKCMQKIMLMHQEKAQNLQLTASGIRLKNRVNNKKR